MKLSPRWRRALSFALVAAVFVFLGAEIYRNAEQLRSFRWDVRPGFLAVSVAVLAGVLLWGVAVWGAVLRKFGATVPFGELARAWFLSNLSRYIPGVVWQFVSLAQLGRGAGLGPSASVMSLLVQMGFLLLSAAVLGVYLLPLSLAGVLAPSLPVLRLLAPFALALVHPAVIRTGLGAVARVTRRETPSWSGTWVDGVLFLLLSAGAWALSGGAFYLFLLSFVDLPAGALPAVIAMNALAFIVGYAAFFAPGGIGFKEAALTLLLAGLMPPAVAASLAIAARLWTVAAELLPIPFLLYGRRGPIEPAE
ncbi:MAG: lysylphosphatidylglycerol synthase domain-containing protein [Gemmatimonadota bacterium]|nr:lysylphosphatidylglycerol synthase domain-containing protein [Gemmatimonadota bacterium]